MKTYIGIIDELGLESFVEKKEKGNFPFGMRATLNKESRNAEAYEVRLTEKKVADVQKSINKKDWIGAKKKIIKYKKPKWHYSS